MPSPSNFLRGVLLATRPASVVRPSRASWGRGPCARGVVAVLALLGLVRSAGAEELVLGLEQAVTGQSNLFRSTTVPIADGNYGITPIIRVQDAAEKLRYSVEYRPSYQAYFKSEGVNGLDHFFRANLIYDVLPVSRFRFRADVADYRSVRGVTADGADGIPDVIPQATGDITRTFVSMDYEHEVTRSMVATAALGLQSYEYTTPSNADSLGVGGDLSLVHWPQADFGFGGSLLASHRRYDALAPQPASQNTVINANLIAVFEPMPDYFVEFSAGPAVILIRQDSFGPEDVNRYFGAVGPFGPVVASFDTTGLRPCRNLNGQPVLLTCPLNPFPTFPGSFTERVAVGYDPGMVPPGIDDDIVTAFASAEFRKEDSWGNVSLSFFRREDASAGVGATTIRDSVTFSVVATPLWQTELRLRGNWNRRTADGAEDRFLVRAGPSTILAPGGLPVAEANGLINVGATLTQTKITQYWADLLLTKEVYDRTWVELGFRYVRQERFEQPTMLTTRFDNLVGSIMVRYEFAPIEF